MNAEAAPPPGTPPDAGERTASEPAEPTRTPPDASSASAPAASSASTPAAPLASPAAPAVRSEREAKPPLVIITGASGGIGQALAERLARPGLVLGLVGRNPKGLEAAMEAVERRGGRAITSRIDITTPAFQHWADDTAERYTFEALYANAGLSAGPPGPNALESAEDTERLVRTNLLANISCIRVIVERMRRQTVTTRPERHIGIVASTAGLMPTPDLAVYSATKAGLIAYGHALRPRLINDGITVTVLCPGFVTSPMSARHKGAKPFEISAERAARKIVAATEGGRRTSVFPLPFRLLSLGEAIAPGGIIDRIVPTFRAEIEPDPRIEPSFKSRRLDRDRFDDTPVDDG
ncbi:SDR family oxidoreductase [Acuticoccus sp. I52.16.1]|uniref:SDR family NAD(P)-dependent oxidoreductase n=1 Tax=Acuticoccus sp. I52.16.1 TaxID=2928472 RepID=UPI001FD02D17|nr:SDR family NAD(P)-dependent oxidoreductase [Acuticoccus sp. I52.16.1]UOM34003.1 SDR family NAD(P)-dependent oxidoreductase [Acuticoccus sp. I52.16.1]